MHSHKTSRAYKAKTKEVKKEHQYFMFIRIVNSTLEHKNCIHSASGHTLFWHMGIALSFISPVAQTARGRLK